MFSLDDIVGQKTLLHFIVCSRGPGSETMTVNLWYPAEKVLELRKENDEFGDETGEIEEGTDELRKMLTSGEGEVVADGILSVDSGFDEGFTYLIEQNVSMKDMLKAIIKFELAANDVTEIEDLGPSELAYATAVYRALVNNWVNIENFDNDESVWSSVAAWRSVEHELMPMWQVEQCMELFSLTKEQVLTCDCPVLRTSMVRPVSEYKGC